MKKAYIIVFVLVLVIVGVVVFSQKEININNVSENIEVLNTENNETSEENKTPVSTESVKVKEFLVVAENFSFTPASISVKKGDTVRITLKNADGFHDLKIDEFNVATDKINAGQEDTVEFIADQSGEFEFYCSVGSHRAMGMVGKIIVE